MALQFGREQRHRNCSRLDRGVKPGDVVQALRREDRHPVVARGGLLQACADGAQSGSQLGPGQFDLPVGRCGVVQVAIGHLVTDIGDVALDQGYQRDPRR